MRLAVELVRRGGVLRIHLGHDELAQHLDLLDLGERDLIAHLHGLQIADRGLILQLERLQRSLLDSENSGPATERSASVPLRVLSVVSTLACGLWHAGVLSNVVAGIIAAGTAGEALEGVREAFLLGNYVRPD